MGKYECYKDSGVQWLGEIPSHWNVLAIKHILKLRKEIVGKKASQYDLLSLTLQGIIKRDMDNPTGKFPSSFDSYQVVYPNDFVFCNFDNEETPRAVGLSDYKGMITGAYDVLYRFNDALTDKFLIYYFLYVDDAKRFKPLYKGLRKSVPYDSFMAYKLPIPTIEEQNRMVAYLDEATSKIDEAIAQQQKMIDLLNERKQIIINNAVTKGLNPDAPMKDSGISWIGDIPKHWEVKHLRNYLTLFSEKGYPKSTLLSVTRELGVILRSYDIEENHNNIPEDLSGYKHVMPGDFIINKMKAWQGSCGVSDYEGIVSPAYFTFKLKNINKEYFQKAIRSRLYAHIFMQYSKGIRIGQWDLEPDAVKNIPIFLPPEEEQNQIIDYLNRNLAGTSKIIEESEKKLLLLQERKQIIINEVVTGKVKV